MIFEEASAEETKSFEDIGPKTPLLSAPLSSKVLLLEPLPLVAPIEKK